MRTSSERLPDFLMTAPENMGAWVARLDGYMLPVLGATASEIDALRTVEDEVDAHLLSGSIGSDPLMTLNVMVHLACLRRGRDGGGPETLTAALVMLGIPPFFAAFGGLQTVEERLSSRPEALAGFNRVLQRSHRAARLAMGFAVHRMDHDAAVLYEAAMLHDFAELLLWVAAPDLALLIADRQAADLGLRSASLQREVLNVELVDLQHQLMLRWGLPWFLVHITDDHARRDTPQLANVRLAIRVARHSASGWDNAALPDDYAELGALLQLGPAHVERLVREIDSA